MKLHSSSFLWIPFLLAVWLFLVVDVLGYAWVRISVLVWEAISTKHKTTRRRLRECRSYGEWVAVAEEMDKLDKTPPAQTEGLRTVATATTTLLNAIQTAAHTIETPNAGPSADNSSTRKIGKRERRVRAVMSALSAACTNNLGNINSESLYLNHCGVNATVEQYAAAITQGISFIEGCGEIGDEEKLEMFRGLSQAYGRSALCLSGGACNGYYHIGVIKCLWENGLLPQIITGSSAGSLVAALVCCRRDEELEKVLCADVADILTACEGSWLSKLLRWVETGYVFDARLWQQKMLAVTCGPQTFKEAYERTGRILNITVFDGGKHSQVLNYRTAPDVVIMSAVLASSSIPHLLEAQQLMVKQQDHVVKPHHALGKFWRDGSFLGDIPIRELQHMFTVNYTLVSQVEPHLMPLVNFEHRGSAGWPTQQRSGWRGGYTLSFLEHAFRLDIKRWLVLVREFNLFPAVFGTDWSHVFVQPMTGTCTVVPPFRAMDLLNLMKDPGRKGMQRYIEVGERAMWRKLSMVKNFRTVEMALAQSISNLSAKTSKPQKKYP